MNQEQLETASIDKLEQLLESLEKRQQETLFLKQYMIFVVGMTEKQIESTHLENQAQSKAAQTRDPISVYNISFADRRKLLKKMHETTRIKLNSQPADRKIESLESELQVYDDILEIVNPPTIRWTQNGDQNLVQLNGEIKRRNNLVDGLNLEKNSLHKHEVKVQKTVNDNEGEVGRSMVDFQCLHIENIEFQKKLNRLTIDVASVKNQLGQSLARLTKMRSELVSLAADSVERESDIQIKQRTDERMKQEMGELHTDIAQLQREVDELKNDIEKWSVPKTQEYIDCVASLRSLEKQKNLFSYKLSLLEKSMSKPSTQQESVGKQK